MKKILVVDDEKTIRDLLAEYLKKNGFEVILAAGGKEGLAILNSGEKIDLLILDKRMPQVSGLDVLKEIKKMNMKVNVLLFSGELNLDEGHKELFKNMGYTEEDIISKPVALSVFLDAVQKKLNIIS